MKTNVKTTLLTAALVAVAGAIATQVKKKGADKTVEDLKDGGTLVLKTIKNSPAGQVAAKVIGSINRRPSNDDAAVDLAELGNTAKTTGQADDELKTGTNG